MTPLVGWPIATDWSVSLRNTASPVRLRNRFVLGQLALDDVLFKRRIQAYKEERFGYSFLEEAATSGKTVVLGLHGSKQLKVRVLEVTDYEVLVADSKDNTSQCKRDRGQVRVLGRRLETCRKSGEGAPSSR